MATMKVFSSCLKVASTKTFQHVHNVNRREKKLEHKNEGTNIQCTKFSLCLQQHYYQQQPLSKKERPKYLEIGLPGRLETRP